MTVSLSNTMRDIKKYVIIAIRILLLVAVVSITYHFLVSIKNIYEVPWNSMYFMNDDEGFFIASSLCLQIMYFLRFPCIRFALLLAGTLGLIVLTIKLHIQPATAKDALYYDIDNSWPSIRDIEFHRDMCVFLITEGVLYPYVKKFFDFILITPISKIALFIKKTIQ